MINIDSQPQVGSDEQQGKFFDVLPSMQNHQENMGIQNENTMFMNSDPSLTPPSLGGDSNFTNILENPTIEPVPMQNLASINENNNISSSFEQPVSTLTETQDDSSESGGRVSNSFNGINVESNNIPLEGPIVVDPFQINTMNNNPIETPVNIPSSDVNHNEVGSPLPTFDFNMQGSSSQMEIPEGNIQTQVPGSEQPLSPESNPIPPTMNMGIPEVPIIEPIPVNSLAQEPVRMIDEVAPLETETTNTVQVPPVAVPPIMNESINPFNMSSQTSSPVNMQMAINVINKANEELQKLGFTTTVEDLDLGNLHQVTIRINK